MALLYWEDSTSSSGLHAGRYGYGGYWNGPYRNMPSIRGKFPGKPVMSYATRVNGTSSYPGMHGADAVDCEPGTVDVNSPYSGTQLQKCQKAALEFIKGWTGGSGLFSRPLVYMFASWQKPIEDYLTANGIARSRYWINSSHATGRAHFCAPSTCGFGRTQADMTQYKFAGSYDISVSQSYMLKSETIPPTGPAPDPPKVGHDTLRNGDHGVAVLRVQQRLYNLHYFTSTKSCDGQFGPATETAIKAFQKAAGFTAKQQDGVVGPMTWAALSRPIPNPAYWPPPQPVVRPAIPAPSLQRGDNGDRVNALQWYLSNSGLRGVRGIKIDGDFGEQTENAVRNFQGYSKLEVVGIYGPKTRAALAQLDIS